MRDVIFATVDASSRPSQTARASAVERLDADGFTERSASEASSSDALALELPACAS